MSVSVRWYFTEPGCSEPGQRWRRMSLHTAVGPDQFCCDTGLCLPSEMRCDNSRDCPDLSDETNCRRYIQAALSLVELLNYCALIGRELHSVEIFS